MSNTHANPDLWNSHALVTDDGKELKKGSVVKDHRGDKHKVVGFQVPHHSGSSGRVFTKHGSKYQYDGQFFPSVVGAKIKERKFSSAGEHVGYHKGFGEGVEVNEQEDNSDYFAKVKVGHTVHYTTPQGQKGKGKVVINKGSHLVLNAGGRSGRPVVVTPKNYDYSHGKTNEETISERDRSEYQANADLSGSRKAPGHYLVKNGTKISGPHASMDSAYSEYRKLDDIRGVKIQHMREDIQEATEKKVKAAAEKAVALAKKKKGSTANTKPELSMPDTQSSQPALMGTEQESETKGA